jgi:phospholipase A1
MILLLILPVKLKFLGLESRRIAVALNHESNEKSDPDSRNWNRVIFHAGFECNNLTIYVRPIIILLGAKKDNSDMHNLLDVTT